MKTAPQPFGPRYQVRVFGVGGTYTGDECVVCGRRTSRKSRTNGTTLHGWVVDGGGRFARLDETDMIDSPGDMGYFPVGSECAKAFPAGYLRTFPGN
jgi:hypothetical protein